ncbi:MAG: phospholipid carrier-dependent glycosyltransferase [Anaerolineae bacterium]
MNGSHPRRAAHPLIAAALLLVMAALAATSITGKTHTADEPKHLTQGYAFVRTGDARLSSHDPPLVNAWSALPLLLIDGDWPQVFTEDNEHWARADLEEVRRPLKPHLIERHALTLARLPIIGLSMILGSLVYRWAREVGGPRAGLISLGLYVLSPNILAHSRLSTTDLGMAWGVFLTAYLIWRYARRPSLGRLALVGIGFGLASMTKHSALVMLGFGPLIAAIIVRLERRPLRVAPLVGLAMAVGWLAAVALFYGVQPRTVLSVEPSYERWVRAMHALRATLRHERLAAAVDGTFTNTPLPAAPYLRGLLVNVILNNAEGHPTYLHGQINDHGWPHYFVTAMLIKTPIPGLLAWLAGLVVGGLSLARRTEADGRRSATAFAVWAFMAVGIVAFMTSSRLHIGLRHVLAAYPFLFCIAGVGIARLWRRAGRPMQALLILLALWYGFEAANIHPHYLEYFNQLVGGPANGYRWLVDSNLDWDQDKGAVGEYERAHGITFQRNPGCTPVTGWVAVSAKHLVGMMDNDPDCYRWTDGYLVDRIRYTWFVFYIPDSAE